MAKWKKSDDNPSDLLISHFLNFFSPSLSGLKRKLDDNPSDFLCGHFINFFLPSLSDKIILLGFIIFPVVNTFTPKFSLYRKNKNKSDFHNFSWCDHVYSRSLQFSGKYPKIDQISRPKKIFLATETIFITSPRKHVNNNCETIFLCSPKLE